MLSMAALFNDGAAYTSGSIHMLCYHRDGFGDGQPPLKDTGTYDGAV